MRMSTRFRVPSGWSTHRFGSNPSPATTSKRKPSWSHSAATLFVNAFRLFDHQKPEPRFSSKGSTWSGNGLPRSAMTARLPSKMLRVSVPSSRKNPCPTDL